MPVFQNVLWGYQLEYPQGWIHGTIQDVDGFAAVPEALNPAYDGPQAGHLLVRGEGNWAGQDIEPIWTRHIGMLGGMLSARDVGLAPWRMGGGAGFEAEIALPKRDNHRLWTGILEFGVVVLKFMASHPKGEREWFEPLVTETIKSLSFPEKLDGVEVSQEGLPLPPGCTIIRPEKIVEDLASPENWRAYDSRAGAGGMQAFFLREAPNHGWSIQEFTPFPGVAQLGFARFRLKKEGQAAVLGILPEAEENGAAESFARLIVRYG